jgi:TPR repeat protein
MKPFRLSLALLSFTPLAACSPPAEPTRVQITVVQPGIEAEQRGNYGFALFTYRDWAHLDVPLAQYRLARLYERGLGTDRDAAEAAKWYRAASEAGYQPARTALARLFEQGRGVPQDDALALALYEIAAAAGDLEAHYEAGRLLEQGRGTGVDPHGAAADYRPAGNAGDIDAQLALAELSPTRRGAPEHVAPHRAGDQVAAADGDPRPGDEPTPLTPKEETPLTPKEAGMPLEGKAAVEPVGVRDEIQERLLKFDLAVEDVAGGSFAEQQTAAGAATAVAYYRQAAQRGDGLAAFELGQAFEQGNGVPPDLVEALTWYGIAQRHGYAPATAHVEALRGELPNAEVQEARGRIDRWWQKFGSS